MNRDRLAVALDDRYRLERELGAGGMATVYLAQDLKHDRRVAIKVLRPELAAVLGAERFVVEIKTTAALQHPHILPLFDSGSADGFLWYAMPYIEGETLRDKLNRETQLGIDEAVRITREVADALDYAHRHGVVHRDIKPENILLHDGRPMVADFGIALALSAAAGGRMTETGMSLGTPHYMSPEQATADKEITGRSDIYSLASVTYEMLTGEPPHMGNSAQQIIMKIVAEPAAPVTKLRRSVPPNVEAAVARALEKLPADRFGTAREFADALGDPGFRTTDTTLGAAAAGSRRRAATLPWLVAAALGIVAVVTTFLAVRREVPEVPTVRFTLDLPSSQQLDSQGEEDAPFAISPDGRHIVYVAIDSASGERQLFLRAIDQLDATPIRGTTDPIAPFFSPDGQWIGYFSDEKDALLKVPMSGGPSITLATDAAPGVASGTWGDDGIITYVARPVSGRPGLSRVPGTGGEPVRIARSDSASGFLVLPVALPGGGAVLAVACRVTCSETRVVHVDVESGATRTLVPGAVRGWYSPTGHLIYASSDGAVFAVPFDPASADLGPTPVPLLEDVRTRREFFARLTVSSAGTMMYLPGEASDGVQLVELDRSGSATELLSTRGRYGQPRLSPTGDRVALTVTTDAGQQIWIYKISDKTLVPLATVGRSYRASWSPDGRRLAFVSERDSSSAIYWMPSDGSAPAELVAPGEVTGGTTSWTRDGRWIVFDGLLAPDATDEQIYAIGTGEDRSRRAVVATRGDDESGTVSPDGQWIAYVSNEGGRSQVFVRRFLAESGRWLVSPGVGVAPLWASDNELLYLDNPPSGRLVSARLAFRPEPEVLERTPLFEWDGYVPSTRSVPNYDISRDGQRVIALRTSGSGALRLAPVVVLNWFAELEERVTAQGGRAR